MLIYEKNGFRRIELTQQRVALSRVVQVVGYFLTLPAEPVIRIIGVYPG